MGSILAFSWGMASMALIVEMLRLKTESKECLFGKNEDLPTGHFVFMLLIIFMLMMSFLRPLWFVVNA